MQWLMGNMLSLVCSILTLQTDAKNPPAFSASVTTVSLGCTKCSVLLHIPYDVWKKNCHINTHASEVLHSHFIQYT